MKGKGGALAPPLRSPLLVPLPRLPRSPSANGLRGRRGKSRGDGHNCGRAKALPFRSWTQNMVRNPG